MKFKSKFISSKKKYTDFEKNFENIHLTAAKIAAVEIMNEAKLLLAANTDGDKQIRYNPKRMVSVSKPGDPPNSDTGRLINSIRFTKDKNAYLVGTNVRYGAYLEFGTTDMAPRPWLTVALDKVADKLPDIIKQAYDIFKGKMK